MGHQLRDVWRDVPISVSQPNLCRRWRQGDVAILDNLSRHKSPGAARALRKIGAWFLFLPP